MQFATHRSGGQPGEALGRYYAKMLQQLGHQGWWPARTRLEVILGAVLTQNTTWQNAARAIRRLRKAGLLRFSRLQAASLADLEACVRPAGFYRQKARAIRTFVDWLARHHHGSVAALFQRSPAELRKELLGLRGLGPETVDAMLLYAGRQPFFVADAYTRRILTRHGLVPVTANYASVQNFLHRYLPADQSLFNEYHALLVEVGKRFCRRQAPRCEGCPLEEFLPRDLGLRPIAESATWPESEPRLAFHVA